MDVDIRLLGRFEVRRGGRPVSLPTRKAEALLAFVAARPRANHRRARLAALLWPDRAEPQARASLRQTVTLLRKALGGVVEAPGDAIALAAGVTVDLVAFDAAVNAGGDALALAAELYGGDLLEAFPAVEEPFEAWLQAERARARRCALEAMDTLLLHLVERGPGDRAIALAERLIALDRTHEPAYRALMRIHAAHGSTKDAARQYERLCKALEETLPSAETRALRESLQRRPATDPAR